MAAVLHRWCCTVLLGSLTDPEAPGTSLPAKAELLYPALGRLEASCITVRVDPAFQKGTRTLNENLRRALLQAQLSDEDVAARLEVDPKTVRRWLEGRLPYLRHRWALATMLDLDETDLWPQTSAEQSRPDEVRAIYPHCDAVPRELWQDLFRSADREIGILADSGLFLAQDSRILAVLLNRAQAGVKLRLCLRDPRLLSRPDDTVARSRNALAQYWRLRETGDVEFRLHRVTLNNSVYRADDTLLIGQRAFGIPARWAPVLHLQRTESGDMATTYFESFNRVWTDALPLTELP
jgi:transcriptional regulator with XRE-family HTH domain